METVYCSVINNQIDGGDCYLICEVADNMCGPFILPDGIDWNEDLRKICLNCPYHDDVE